MSLPRRKSDRDRPRRLEGQMRAVSSVANRIARAFEVRRADHEAAAIAVERIRSGAVDHMEDGAEALAKLGIEIPVEE